ncbi:MAG: peptidoglycan DD-metalloendopeptidase family protein [Cyanobacteria bacterium P01_G01_bin.19]
MTYIPAIRWNRLLTIAIATILLSLGANRLQNLRSVASQVPEKALLAQEVSAIWEKGSFPVENFQSYTSPFGYRISPIDGRRQFHNGLDLAAPRGSYIRNWWGGKITKLSDNTACGTSVTIQSGAWTHGYCHMEGHVEHHSSGVYLVDRDGGIQLTLGQDIPVGARIGRIGMTGRTTGPHLHWVLKHNGNYVDPGLVLKEMFKRQAAS